MLWRSATMAKQQINYIQLWREPRTNAERWCSGLCIYRDLWSNCQNNECNQFSSSQLNPINPTHPFAREFWELHRVAFSWVYGESRDQGVARPGQRELLYP